MTTEADGAEREARIEAAKQAVLAQVPLLHEQFGRAASHWKADGTRVTAADLAISEGIFRELGAKFPHDQYFSEELADPGGPVPLSARFAWVLDPIDGTNNFALGIPFCAISLALLEAGRPVYGVVYDLARRRLMHGGPGYGLTDGERPARAADAAPHPESLVAFHAPLDKALLPLADAVLARFKVRATGSATLNLAYVAAGLVEGAVDYNVRIWDIAAAVALCWAGGAAVEFLNGAQFPMRQFDLGMKRIVFVAGGPRMAAALKELSSPGSPNFSQTI